LALVLIALAATLLAPLAACGQGASLGDAGSSSEDRSFSELEEAARGTTVNFSMYGGDEDINTYVDDYIAPNLKEKYDIALKRTPLPNAAEAVDRLLDEKNAGQDEGTTDLLWLNGENFATGADAGLWFGPWAERLPNAKYIDWESPSISRDFGYPVEGREAPWGKVQFVMIYDAAKVDDPPKDMDELLAWTEDNPGRFTYPAPPDFTGNAFIEQVLYGVTGEIDPYQKPFDEGAFERKTPEAYAFLNEIEPYLWREGETYPKSSTQLDELYQNGEIYLSMSYDPQFAQQQVDEGLFAQGTRTYVLDGGTLSSTHYVAIPLNSPNKAGAQVVANFLQSPEAQIEKQDPGGWGDLTVLSVDRLPEDFQQKLAKPEGEATLSVRELQENQLPEARSEWLLKLKENWPENVLEE
jgi:putative spermidine/putrescine transport system substrate-binding protein